MPIQANIAWVISTRNSKMLPLKLQVTFLWRQVEVVWIWWSRLWVNLESVFSIKSLQVRSHYFTIVTFRSTKNALSPAQSSLRFSTATALLTDRQIVPNRQWRQFRTQCNKKAAKTGMYDDWHHVIKSTVVTPVPVQSPYTVKSLPDSLLDWPPR